MQICVGAYNTCVSEPHFTLCNVLGQVVLGNENVLHENVHYSSFIAQYTIDSLQFTSYDL